MDDLEEFEMTEAENTEQVALLAHHKISIIARLLIDKGIISASDLTAKELELASVDEETDEEEVDDS